MELPIKPGGVFYRKEEGDNEFSRCVFSMEEMVGDRGPMLEFLTKKYFNEGRLFVVRNRPWQSITK